ncbi:hypothetical protein RFI_22495, partial [Reticulomyxa filosa]
NIALIVNVIVVLFEINVILSNTIFIHIDNLAFDVKQISLLHYSYKLIPVLFTEFLCSCFYSLFKQTRKKIKKSKLSVNLLSLVLHSPESQSQLQLMANPSNSGRLLPSESFTLPSRLKAIPARASAPMFVAMPVQMPLPVQPQVVIFSQQQQQPLMSLPKAVVVKPVLATPTPKQKMPDQKEIVEDQRGRRNYNKEEEEENNDDEEQNRDCGTIISEMGGIDTHPPLPASYQSSFAPVCALHLYLCQYAYVQNKSDVIENLLNDILDNVNDIEDCGHCTIFSKIREILGNITIINDLFLRNIVTMQKISFFLSIVVILLLECLQIRNNIFFLNIFIFVFVDIDKFNLLQHTTRFVLTCNVDNLSELLIDKQLLQHLYKSFVLIILNLILLLYYYFLKKKFKKNERITS